MVTKAKQPETKRPKQNALSAVTREYIKVMEGIILGPDNYGWNKGHTLNKLFEEAFCRCSPLRGEMDKLIAKKRAAMEKMDIKMEQARAAYNEAAKPWDEQIQELNARIIKIDQEDHPKGESMWRQGMGWVRLWVMQKAVAGIELPTEPQELRELFVNEVAMGWRPRPAKEDVI